jgi:lipopolysaccharide transport system ATP-binding protein
VPDLQPNGSREDDPASGLGPSQQCPGQHFLSTNDDRSVGIVGTFDVENYGDLLFPLMAQAAFSQRGQEIDVVPFSPSCRSAESWPYEVYSTLDLPMRMPSLSALLIGGGQIIRFDKGYPLTVDPRVNVPLDYWLTPAAMAALIGVPLIWNAVGAWTDSPTAPWADSLVAATLSASHIVALRDEASRRHLAAVANAVDFEIVPDTVFSIARHWPLCQASDAFIRWRLSHGITGRYAVVQADAVMAKRHEVIDDMIGSLGFETVVLLPVCRCHGDDGSHFPPPRRCTHVRSEWPTPRLLAEIIARSEWTIASSLHACITALSYGVPVVRVPSSNAADKKFELLERFTGIAHLDQPHQVTSLAVRPRAIDPEAVACAARLDTYWDRVLEVILNPSLSDAGRSRSTMLRWLADAMKVIEVAGIRGIP